MLERERVAVGGRIPRAWHVCAREGRQERMEHRKDGRAGGRKPWEEENQN